VNLTEIRTYRDTAVAIAEAAGPIALRYFRTSLVVDDKSGGGVFDPVTRADREIESFIRTELGRRFPSHGVLGEEGGLHNPDAAIRWVIDPIDGTRAFMSGMPAWGILLGLTEGGACLAGVMHQPYLAETFSGGAGDAWMRHAQEDVRLQTRRTTDLSAAVVYCTHPSMFAASEARGGFERLSAASRMMRYGGDCYSYCLLALGQIDLVIENGLQPYDIIPLVPIIEGAGGIVTDGRGGPAGGGGLIVAAATRELHRRALAMLNETGSPQ